MLSGIFDQAIVRLIKLRLLAQPQKETLLALHIDVGGLVSTSARILAGPGQHPATNSNTALANRFSCAFAILETHRVSPTARMQGFSMYFLRRLCSVSTDHRRYGTLCPARARGHYLRQQTRRQACSRLSCTQSRSRNSHSPVRNALCNMVHHLPQTRYHRSGCPLQRREKESGKLSYYANIQLPYEACGMRGMD